MYSDLYLKRPNRFLPFIVGTLSVFVLAAGFFYYTSQNSTPTRASESETVAYEIANVNAKQFSVYWESKEKEKGWVMYGTDPEKLESSASDLRDSTEKIPFHLHLVTLKNLKPNTSYYFKIISGNTIYTDVDKPYKFTTPKDFPSQPYPQPAYGKITLQSGTPVQNAIVKATIGKTFPLITLTKTTGEWLLPLQSLIQTTDLETVPIHEYDEVSIKMIDDNKTTSMIKTVVSKTSPLPQTVVLGTDYEFTDKTDVLQAFTTEEQSPVNTNEIDILFPKPGAVIPATRPLIKGVAIPKSKIELELNSLPPFRFVTKVDARGNWVINVPKPLSPGEYTLYMYAQDPLGVPVTISRSFTLAKDGEQVLGDATAAATVTLAPTVALPTIVPTTALPTAIPTGITPAVTLTSPATVSATLMPTWSQMYATPTPAPPVTGGNGIMYTAISVGLLIVGAGVMLVL